MRTSPRILPKYWKTIPYQVPASPTWHKKLAIHKAETGQNKGDVIRIAVEKYLVDYKY